MGRGFQRHDFISGGGPGLAKLRAAGSVGDPAAPKAAKIRQASLTSLLALMDGGQWAAAITLAGKWPDLGEEAVDIKRGAEAILRPRFQKQLGRDPAQLIDAAKAALIRRYGNV